MPTRLKCNGCGTVLEEWPTLPEASGNEYSSARHFYESVFNRVRGRCPKCRRALPSPLHFGSVMRVDVKPNPCWRRPKVAK